MKKPIIFILILAAVFISAQVDKKVSVSLTVEQWQGVLNVIEQSSAPHTDVKAVQQAIIGQIQEQLKQDTVKKK